MVWNVLPYSLALVYGIGGVSVECCIYTMHTIAYIMHSIPHVDIDHWDHWESSEGTNGMKIVKAISQSGIVWFGCTVGFFGTTSAVCNNSQLTQRSEEGRCKLQSGANVKDGGARVWQLYKLHECDNLHTIQHCMRKLRPASLDWDF